MAESGVISSGHENSVKSLLQCPFEKRTLAEKLKVKELGPDQPDLLIRQQTSEKEMYTRSYSSRWYTKKAWLCGCVSQPKEQAFQIDSFEIKRRNPVTVMHYSEICSYRIVYSSEAKAVEENQKRYENHSAELDKALELLQEQGLFENAWTAFAPEMEAECLECIMERIDEEPEQENEKDDVPEYQLVHEDGDGLVQKNQGTTVECGICTKAVSKLKPGAVMNVLHRPSMVPEARVGSKFTSRFFYFVSGGALILHNPTHSSTLALHNTFTPSRRVKPSQLILYNPTHSSTLALHNTFTPSRRVKPHSSSCTILHSSTLALHNTFTPSRGLNLTAHPAQSYTLLYPRFTQHLHSITRVKPHSSSCTILHTSTLALHNTFTPSRRVNPHSSSCTILHTSTLALHNTFTPSRGLNLTAHPVQSYTPLPSLYNTFTPSRRVNPHSSSCTILHSSTLAVHNTFTPSRRVNPHSSSCTILHTSTSLYTTPSLHHAGLNLTAHPVQSYTLLYLALHNTFTPSRWLNLTAHPVQSTHSSTLAHNTFTPSLVKPHSSSCTILHTSTLALHNTFTPSRGLILTAHPAQSYTPLPSLYTTPSLHHWLNLTAHPVQSYTLLYPRLHNTFTPSRRVNPHSSSCTILHLYPRFTQHLHSITPG
ncbi:hypothetical protein HF521_018088 [Silurus meridionalis]|uniref:Uncharacterized protein n=1 Tax=Silurus meridionalis TaxID=175797 RepID=A0A8T0BNV3_SILME|nr:hypothetical protein HF521_018088 [Silurus meridionalis]